LQENPEDFGCCFCSIEMEDLTIGVTALKYSSQRATISLQIGVWAQVLTRLGLGGLKAAGV
jgi:hypothetical protein